METIIPKVMSRENADIFLEKTIARVDNGEFDKYLTLPFVTKKLLKSNITSVIELKIVNDSTPILSDNDIEALIKTINETAGETAGLFLKLGIMERDENDNIVVNSKWEKFLNK